MQILEIDQSPKLKKAAALVGKLYDKAGKFLQWNDEGNPTITGLVAELNNPFLTELVSKKDLDLFIDVAQRFVDLDVTDIINTRSTGTSNTTDMIKDPVYFAKKKGKVFKIFNMSPEDYIRATKAGFTDPRFTPEADLVEAYTYELVRGSQMPLMTLEYELIGDDEMRGEYTSFAQEGRHRAYVAKGVGAKSIPVMVVASVWPPHTMQDKLKPYAETIWSKFD